MTLIRDDWGLYPASTAWLYETGLRLRAPPSFGHIRAKKTTTGTIKHPLNVWESGHSASTVKSSSGAVVLGRSA